jgi:hypothetical protein
MTSAPLSRLSIAPQQGQQPLTAAQKKFNTLIQKIEAQRKLLTEWNLTIPVFRQKRAKDLGPLQATYQALNVELVQFLDQAASQPGLSKTDRDTLSETISELAVSLMDGPARDAMKALYNKHSGGDFDAEAAQEQDELKALLKEKMGVDFGDDVDMNSHEDVLQRLKQLSDAEAARAADEQDARQSKRKKSTRQVKHEAEQQQVGQSLREVYRKLASALHPDREPDPVEHERKTALMKRVNQAYASKNLLDLLTLQLEVELIDPQGILTLGDERLKRYNQILADQLVELQQETASTENAFKFELGLDPNERLSPASLLRELKTHVRMLQEDIGGLKAQRRGLDDQKNLKRWLKQQRAQGDTLRGLEDLFDRLR